MPGMPEGKLAGMRCIHLDDRNLCRLYGRPERPAFCRGWQPDPAVCGDNFQDAMTNIAILEMSTRHSVEGKVQTTATEVDGQTERPCP